MKATLYKELSDASTIVEIESGKSIYENFENIRLDNKIILVDGVKKNTDYIVKESDNVVIRSIPGGSPDVLDVVLTIINPVVGIAVYLGKQAYSFIDSFWKMRQQLAEIEAANSTTTTSDSITNVPYLKGASNSVATGKTQPYVMGKHLFTPYLLSDSFSEISGTDGANQYRYILLEGGFNSQILKRLYCEDIKLKTWDDSLTTPQEGVYSFDTDSVFYDANNLVEISQDGASFATAQFNKKFVVQEPGDELKKSDDDDYEALVYTLEDYTKSVDICILINGLRAYNTSGDKITRTISILPEYSYDSGATWNTAFFDINGVSTNTISGNVSKQLRYNCHIDFPYASVIGITDPVMIRLSCSTTAYDGTAYDDVYVQYINCEIFNYSNSVAAGSLVTEKPIEDTEAALSTRIGLKILATTSNTDKLSSINVITKGIARTWNGTEWSSTKSYTSNLAAWMLEVLTSPTHTASKCADSEIDLDSFGEFYEYCETNSIYINQVLTDGDTKENILASLADIGNSMIYRDIYGKKSIATDKVKENAIAILNTQNLISFENKKEMARQTDGILITFVNEDTDYTQDNYLVMRDGVTRSGSSTLRSLTVDGITSYNAIVKYARRLMAIEKLRPKTITAKVGLEGTYYTPLSKVFVQHPSLKIGLGSAEIKSVITSGTNIVGLELYEPIEYDSTDADGFGVVIQAVSETYCTSIAAAYTATTDGLVSEIVLSTPIALSASAIPHAGDILSYGYLSSGAFGTITSPMMITGIEPGSGEFSLTLVDYNEAIYDYGTIPDYVPNISTRKKPISSPASIPAASKDELAGLIGNVVSGTTEAIPDNVSAVSAVASKDGIKVSATWAGTGLSNSITGFIFSYSKNSGTTWTEKTIASNILNYEFDRSVDGYPEKSALTTWRFRVKALNSYGNVSATWGGTEAGVSVDTTSYLTWIPPKPVVTVVAKETGLQIDWTISTDAYYGTNKSYKVTLGSLVKKTGVLMNTYFYPFDRNIEGYPEKVANGGTLDNLNIYITAVTDEKTSGTVSDASHPSVSSYLTWIPAAPTLSVSAAGRKITISLKQSTSTYGFSTFRLRIRRSDEASWYALGASADAYGLETAYKTGSAGGYTETPLATYDIAVPLKNQTLNLPEDTSYYFEASTVCAVPTTASPSAVNASAYGTDMLAIAKGTGVYDVVSKAIKTAQLDDDAVTLDKLNVLATNLVNQLTENGNVTGWNGGMLQASDSTAGYYVGSIPVSTECYTNTFTVNPTDIIKLSLSVRSLTSATIELCAGDSIHTSELYYFSTWNATTKTWGEWLPSTVNSRFIFTGSASSISTSYLTIETYLAGSSVAVSELPAPSSALGSTIVAVRTRTNTARISAKNTSSTGIVYLFAPSARNVSGGTITANNIVVEKLTSITNKLGTVEGDDSDNYVIVLSPSSTETRAEGTLLLGATTDASYLRRYKTGGVWYLDIKTSRFVVDSVSSKIYGTFEVFPVGSATANFTVVPSSYVGVYGVPALIYPGAAISYNQGPRFVSADSGSSTINFGCAWATTGWQAGQITLGKLSAGGFFIDMPTVANTAQARALTIAHGGAVTLASSLSVGAGLTVTGTITTTGIIYSGAAVCSHGRTFANDGVSGNVLGSGYININGATPYIDFCFANATSYTSRFIEVAAGIVTTPILRPTYLGRVSHSSGCMIGSYNNVGANDAKTNPIYCVGSAYVPTDTALGVMFGIGYSHSNFFGTATAKSGWGLYMAVSGVVQATLTTGGIWTSGALYAAGAATIGGALSVTGAATISGYINGMTVAFNSDDSITIGQSTEHTASGIEIGKDAVVKMTNTGSSATSASNSIAIGTASQVHARNDVSAGIGYAEYCIAVGYSSLVYSAAYLTGYTCTSSRSSAFGYYSQISAVGYGKASSDGCVAVSNSTITSNSQVSGSITDSTNCISIGYQNVISAISQKSGLTAYATGSIILGSNCHIYSSVSSSDTLDRYGYLNVLIGAQSYIENARNCVIIGQSSHSTYDYVIAIGASITAKRKNEINIGGVFHCFTFTTSDTVGDVFTAINDYVSSTTSNYTNCIGAYGANGIEQVIRQDSTNIVIQYRVGQTLYTALQVVSGSTALLTSNLSICFIS